MGAWARAGYWEGMVERSEADNSLVIHFKNLRKAIGFIGVALPFVLILGNQLVQASGLLGSISSYYHSVMRDIFVGSLCAVGTFLISYRGYDKRDNRAGWVAGTSVIGVALCPTTMEGGPGSSSLLGALHLAFAAVYFATLAYFSLVLFRETKDKATRTTQKRRRDVVYAICGSVMVLCLLLIVLVFLLPENSEIRQHHPVLWLESAAILAFGISWFTKGEWLFPDPSHAARA